MFDLSSLFTKKPKLPAEKISVLEQETTPKTGEQSQPAKRLPKFRRAPEKLPRREITRIDFDIIKLLHDFKFLSSTQLWKLARADRKAVYKHLQTLYHQQLINRFNFPTMFGAGEFFYYLDNTQALDLLVTEAGHQKTEFHYEEVRRNKQKAYGDMRFDGSENNQQEGKLLFLRHETMISRFHVALELACRATNGRVILKTWKQGAELRGYVFAPAYSRVQPRYG
jgi:Replication-relaxation